MENNGLNGWFGRALKKLIVKVAQVIDNATMGILNVEAQVSAIGSGDAEFWDKVATAEPTPYEETVLTNWNNTKFAPYCATLASRILEMEGSSSAQGQVDIINDIKAQMCGVRSYFLTNETTGLQKVGIDTRTDLIDESFLLLQDKMDAVAAALGTIRTEIVIPNYGNVFGGLIIPYHLVGPISCEKHFPPSADTAPVSVTQVIAEATPTNTTSPSQPQTPSTPTVPTSGKDNCIAGKAFLLAGLLLLIGWAFSGDDDKKKKKSNNNKKQ